MAASISIDDLHASPANSHILAALAHQGGLTREEIYHVAYVGMTTLSGGGYLQRLRHQGLIYISGWRRSASGSFSVPQFSLGAGPDFPRPTINLTNRTAAGMERLVDAIRSNVPLDYRQAAASGFVAQLRLLQGSLSANADNSLRTGRRFRRQKIRRFCQLTVTI